MKNIKQISRVIIFATMFLYLFTTCSDNGETIPSNLQLTEERWLEILYDIASKDELVELDLSTYLRSNINTGGGLRSDGTFDPMKNWSDETATKGKSKITKLILPNTATSILSGIITENSSLNTVIGNNITHISEMAFSEYIWGVSIIENVSFPNVKEVGRASFMNTQIKEIEFPMATLINNNAFNGCKLLEKANLPEVVAVKEMAFASCDSLELLHLPKVEEIDSAVFSYPSSVSLKIILGKNPPKLKSMVFYDGFNTRSIVKHINIDVPFDASSFYVNTSGTNSTVNWSNGLRGLGWNGSVFETSDMTHYSTGITVIINRIP